jgi:hypothetical protein
MLLDTLGSTSNGKIVSLSIKVDVRLEDEHALRLTSAPRNSSTSPSYSLTFTNTTASLTITTNMLNLVTKRLVSTLTLTFTGSRNDTSSPSSKSQHDLNPIQLNTSDPSIPRFQFLNSSDIFFANISSTWSVAATPISTSTSIQSSRTISSTKSTTSTSTTTTAKGNGASPIWRGHMGGGLVEITKVVVVSILVGLAV